MFGFKKSYKPLSEYPESWALKQAEYEGLPVIIRKQEGFKEAIGHSDFQFQIGVAVPLLAANEQGLPEKEEADQLNKIEDNLCAELQKDGDAALVLVITTKGMREFVFYAKEWKPEEFEARVKEVSNQSGAYKLQFIMQHDPKWAVFKSY